MSARAGVSHRMSSCISRIFDSRWFGLLLFAFCLSCVLYRQAHAATVPVGFTDRQVAAGLTSPTAMTILPDGRVLVVQQNGAIRLIKSDTLLPANFYAVPSVDSFAERGCLGIVSDPAFATNGYVYIYCTVNTGATSRNQIMRVTAAGDVAAAGSAVTILALPNVPAGVQWHMGGAMRFGIDGKLYVAVGGQEDLRVSPPSASNSQNLSNPFGKLLRLNADGSFPSDNPYFNVAGAYRGNFNLGLRNPFAFDIQPGTGLIYINDVGAGTWEEINRGLAGANYGWPEHEGDNSNPRYTNAVHAYDHTLNRCAITGGAFYNPPAPQFPDSYTGKYLFADFCSGAIYQLDPANPANASEFVSGIGNPVNLAVSSDGSLYYLARNQNVGTPTASGTVSKINYTGSQAPRIAQQPLTQIIYTGNPVTFSVAANGATSFQWQRNGAIIPGATAASYTLAATSAADNQASFTVIVGNEFGTTTSSVALLTVTNNQPPVASITSPAAVGGFKPGDRVRYAGTAQDPEDGVLPASAFTWQADFHHDTHSHPLLAATSGVASGTLTLPEFEADASNTWIRFSLSVKDSAGQVQTVTRDVYPYTQINELKTTGTPTNGFGPIEKNMSNGEGGAGDGDTITLGGIPYKNGLGMHAPSDVRFDLGGQCSGNLVTDVGIDDEVGDQGSAIFQVFLDGALAYDSGLMRGGDARKTINLSVAGKSELRFAVTDGGDGDAFDHADWAGARVTGCPVPEQAGGGAIASPSSGGGGGGCSTGGDGRFDPTLIGLLLAALGLLGWRHRKHKRK